MTTYLLGRDDLAHIIDPETARAYCGVVAGLVSNQPGPLACRECEALAEGQAVAENKTAARLPGLEADDDATG
jgi:hypothetical protein